MSKAYLGSKATSASCQPMIGMMPHHDVYIETHLAGNHEAQAAGDAQYWSGAGRTGTGGFFLRLSETVSIPL
ncbi:MAG: hypothetical protein OXE56_10905 [Gammaproteobacteria bacterium]|nr:hypothetical protein [Gammaproteobacteria bacterium]